MRRQNIIKNLLFLLTFFLVMGVAFATFYSEDIFSNGFITASYGAQSVETFASPENWSPGDETPKTVIVRNTGSICEKVRISYTESWEDAEGEPLPLTFETGKRTAILNLDNTSDWLYSDGYYYYNGDLLSGESTSSFLRSVTFNPEYAGDITCSTVDNITKCSPSGSSYLGGNYELVFIVETIQCDVASEEWNFDSYHVQFAGNGGTTTVPNSADIDEIIEIHKPSKTYTLSIQNNQGATVLDSSNQPVSSIQQNQTFDGWTGTNINTSTALYGASNDNLSSWSSGSTKIGANDSSVFLKNLASPKATVTLTANWVAPSITLPTVTKLNSSCTFNTKSDGSGTSYASGGVFAPSITTNSETLYVLCDTNVYHINYVLNGGENASGTQNSISGNSVLELVKPTKSFVVNIDGNNQGATISSLTASSNQTFDGWTGTDLGVNAKYGTSSNTINTSWDGSLVGASNSTMYFKDLVEFGDIATLTAHWSSATITLPTITKADSVCSFNTEIDGSGTSYASGESYLPNSSDRSDTLYAICLDNHYTINYAMNGGVKGTNGPASADIDEVITIDKPTKTFVVTIDPNSQGATISSITASREQYFNGWTASGLDTRNAKYGTSSNSVTTAWNSESTKVGSGSNAMYFKNLTGLEQTVTLTANWIAATITLPTVEKANYSCSYNTAIDGSGTSYNSSAGYVPSVEEGSTRLFAICRENIYAITLDSQSATTQGTQTIYEKYSLGFYHNISTTTEITTSTNAITKPTRSGYVFGGYYTEMNGGGVQFIDENGYLTSYADNTYFEDNDTLYAKWDTLQYSIHYSMNNGTLGVGSPTSASGGEVIAVNKPTKEVTISFLDNNSGASIKDSLNNEVTSISATQTFDGWTATGLTATAKYGSSNDSVTTSWSNGSTKIGSNEVLLNQSSYTIVSNDGTYPYAFNSTTNVWSSSLHTDDNTASFEFRLPAGDYILNYTISSESDYDKASIYKNGNLLVNNVSGISSDTVVLSNVTVSDLFKVTYSKDSSVSKNDDMVSFSIIQNVSLPTMYFKDLRDQIGDVTLTANWKDSRIILPTLSKTGYSCYYSTSSTFGSGTYYSSGQEYILSNDSTDLSLYVFCSMKITLDRFGGTSGSLSGGATEIYVKSGVGFYTDLYLTQQITTNSNSVSLPSKTGFIFGGYYTQTNGGGVQYIDENGYLTSYADNTYFVNGGALYAKWTEISYSIDYVMNGGVNGVNAPTSAIYSQVITINKPTKSFTVNIDPNSQNAVISALSASTSQVFDGWTASDLGNNARYGNISSSVSSYWSNGSTKVGANVDPMYFKMLRSASGTVTLIANWSSVDVILPTISKEGYYCIFTTNADGSGDVYESGDTFTPVEGASTTLYARCGDQYALTLNNQGATTAGTSTIYEKFGDGYYLDSSFTNQMTNSMNAIMIPTKTDYLFAGYFTESNGQGTKIINGNGYFTNNSLPTYFIADTTLYAFWVPPCSSFATDSWETIISCVETGNTSAYQVGNTRTITLGNGFGTHTLRVSNNTTPSECSSAGFSQSACGFVVEFADIISNYYFTS